MTITCWNDLEDGQLQGAPLASQILYLRGLRKYMDYETGLVGAKRRTSWQALTEVLYVEPHQGETRSGSYSKQQVRRLAKRLETLGLVEMRSDQAAKHLVFFLPLAFTDRSVQKKADTNPTQTRHTKPDTEPAIANANNGGASVGKGGTEPDTNPTHPKIGKADRHPISDIKDKKPYTEADASVSAQPVVLRNPIPSPTEPQRQAPLLPPVVLTSTTPAPEPTPKVAKPRVSTVPAWTAYSAAYHERYGVDPVRNGTVNGQLAHLVRRLGDETPDVARYYLDLEDGLYRREGHSVGILLKHCEHLRTLWARSRRASPAGEISADDVVVAL